MLLIHKLQFKGKRFLEALLHCLEFLLRQGGTNGLCFIELRKDLNGNGRMDDWIRLINAETEADLKMLQAKTNNSGILAAIKEIRNMNLGKYLKVMYDMRMKEIRDRHARDEYVRDEGLAEGTVKHILQLLAKKGTIPEDLEKAIQSEKNIDILSEWFTLAIDMENVDDFRKKTGI